MSRETKVNSKFICELCSKKAGMVIKEYRTGRWLCYDCYFRKKVSKGTGEALLKGGE